MIENDIFEYFKSWKENFYWYFGYKFLENCIVVWMVLGVLNYNLIIL